MFFINKGRKYSYFLDYELNEKSGKQNSLKYIVMETPRLELVKPLFSMSK
jgi:hypothetical protein